jgi:hypothetical protein
MSGGRLVFWPCASLPADPEASWAVCGPSHRTERGKSLGGVRRQLAVAAAGRIAPIHQIEGGR